MFNWEDWFDLNLFNVIFYLCYPPLLKLLRQDWETPKREKKKVEKSSNQGCWWVSSHTTDELVKLPANPEREKGWIKIYKKYLKFCKKEFKMSDSNMSMDCEETQLLIVDDDLDIVPGRFISAQTGLGISPPPLIGLDRPGPPNMAVLGYPSCSRYCRYVMHYF